MIEAIAKVTAENQTAECHVFRVTSLVTAHTKKMVITASRYISWEKILKLHHVVLTYVTLMVLQHKRLILNQSK